METNNKLIAEFIGYKEYVNEGAIQLYIKDKVVKSIGQLDFHSDWSWLMQVVEKIESLTDINSNGCFVLLESIGFNAKFIFDDGTRILKDSKGETKIEAVYNACVEFIKWYNENKD